MAINSTGRDNQTQKWGKAIVGTILAVVFYVLINQLVQVFEVAEIHDGGELVFTLTTLILPIFIAFLAVYGIFK